MSKSKKIITDDDDMRVSDDLDRAKEMVGEKVEGGDRIGLAAASSLRALLNADGVLVLVFYRVEDKKKLDPDCKEGFVVGSYGAGLDGPLAALMPMLLRGLADGTEADIKEQKQRHAH